MLAGSFCCLFSVRGEGPRCRAAGLPRGLDPREEAAAETEVVEETETEEETAEEAESEEETEEAEEEATEEETEEEAEPLTEEQLIEQGYRKIQILNQNGTNLYDNTTDEAAVIGIAETGAELWIKDAEAEGWAEIYSEEEMQKFIRLAEIEKQLSFEEQMLADGYWRAQIALRDGAKVFSIMDENTEPIMILEAGTELWLKIIWGTEWATVYCEENEQVQYIRWDATVITLKPEEDTHELVMRSVVLSSSLEDTEFVFYGTTVELVATLEGFQEDDEFTVQWMYSNDNGENFFKIEDANELTYEFDVMPDNVNNIWRIVITLMPKE